MFPDQIERMKRQYTDKYVVVDGTRPELARFRDVVGRVKTVNMSGRALVEFDDYHLNTGWYDIDPEFLKVVDKPPPKAPKPEAKKPAAKAEAKSAAAAERQAAKAPAPAAMAGKQSVADILAAARAGKNAAPSTPAARSDAESPTKPAPPPKVDRSKMSVADMLVAARAGGAGKAAPAEPKPAPQAPPKVQVQAATDEPAAESAPGGEVASATGSVIKPVDKSGMSIDQILAYCRQHDAK